MAKRKSITEDTAALFMNGRSQAVRLPKAFRFEGDRVHIRREGERVIFEPIEKRGWPPGFWERFDELPPLPDEFEEHVRAFRARASADWETRFAEIAERVAEADVAPGPASPAEGGESSAGRGE